MDHLVFHEDETGIATLFDLRAFEFFDGYPNSEAGALAMGGVWSPVREDRSLRTLGITLAELDSVVPAALARVRRVSSYYGPKTNLTTVPGVAFGLDENRALVAEAASDGIVTSIWILDHSPDPIWTRQAMTALAGRWQLLVSDDYFDFQFPLARADMLDAWLEARRTRGPSARAG